MALHERYERHTVRGNSKRQPAPAILLWHCACEQRRAASRGLRFLTFLAHGYRVAGKTGTAYKVINGQYDQTAYISSFVGYGPASNPRYILAITIDEPSAGKHYGAEVSAPVFSNVMTQALRMAGVAPDAPAVANDSSASKIKPAVAIAAPVSTITTKVGG